MRKTTTLLVCSAYLTHVSNYLTIYTAFCSKLTSRNREDLKQLKFVIHDLAQWQPLAQKFPAFLSNGGVCPEILEVCVRKSEARTRRPQSLSGFGLMDSPDRAWINALLTYPAHPRLRELRLQLQVLNTPGEKALISTLVEKIRGAFHTLQRSDHFGDQVDVRLDDTTKERSWIDDVTVGSRHETTLVWKFTPADRIPESQTSFSGTLHTPGQDLPKLDIENID
jgi:hypothetical protein